MYITPHYINGQIYSPSNSTLEIYNPATGEVIGKVLRADAAVVNLAVAKAKAALPAWSALTPLKRSRLIFKLRTLLEENTDLLAELVTREHGKTFNDARASVGRGIDVVEFVCGIPSHLKGSFSENVATDIDSYSFRQPLGVCVGITPFNFPAMIPLWMFPMAIACGNTFILKPSEKDPSCAIKIAELCTQAGIPDGVVNVVQGDSEAVNTLLVHPDVQAISFVGSTPIAEHVYHTGLKHGKRVQAFGGSKNHCVVMPDADLDQTVDALVGAGYGSAGERCMAISVVVAIGDTTGDALIAKLKPRVEALKIGPGTDDVDFGPLVTKSHWEKVKSYVDIGIHEGAKLIVDGSHFKMSGYENGFYMGGTLFDHVHPHMRIYREEIFGPVLIVMRVPDLETAIQLASNHEFGNGTAIFTRDGEAARTYAHRVQVGMIGVNVPIPVPVAFHSFGGWKRSIFGDLNMYGAEGVQFYTRLKTVTQRWLKGDSLRLTEFTLPTTK